MVLVMIVACERQSELQGTEARLLFACDLHGLLGLQGEISRGQLRRVPGLLSQHTQPSDATFQGLLRRGVVKQQHLYGDVFRFRALYFSLQLLGVYLPEERWQRVVTQLASKGLPELLDIGTPPNSRTGTDPPTTTSSTTTLVISQKQRTQLELLMSTTQHLR